MFSAGDLTTEIDSRVKSSVAEFCGKDDYEVGDLSAEINKRSRAKVFEFIGKEVRYIFKISCTNLHNLWI